MFFLELSDALSSFFPGREAAFEALVNVDGTLVAKEKGERTVRFERGGKGYEIVVQGGSGAKRIWPTVEKLQALGISTPRVLGKGLRRNVWGRCCSFTITEGGPPHINLDDLLTESLEWPEPCQSRLKRMCLTQLGDFFGRMHRNGIQHRSASLDSLTLESRDWADAKALDGIGIQVGLPKRAKIRKNLSRRQQIKDLGHLLKSAFDAEVSVTDAIRFIRAYYGDGAWRDSYLKDQPFWYRVISRAMMERALELRRERKRDRWLSQR